MTEREYLIKAFEAKKNLHIAINSKNYININKYTEEIRRLEAIYSNTTVYDINMSNEDKTKANLLIKKMFLLGDVLDSTVVDLIELLNKKESNVSLPIKVTTTKIKKLIAEIIEMTKYQSTDNNEIFADTADTLNELVDAFLSNIKK